MIESFSFKNIQEIIDFYNNQKIKATDTKAIIKYLVKSNFDLSLLETKDNNILYWLYFFTNLLKEKDSIKQLDFIDKNIDFFKVGGV